jgi:hypothetical protein
MPDPEHRSPNQHKYDQPGLSPKAFLLEVMWDPTVKLSTRIDAAEAAGHLVVPGDFREPDLSYRIPPLEVIEGGNQMQRALGPAMIRINREANHEPTSTRPRA